MSNNKGTKVLLCGVLVLKADPGSDSSGVQGLVCVPNFTENMGIFSQFHEIAMEYVSYLRLCENIQKGVYFEIS